MNKRIRWKLGALASAVALSGSLVSLEAQALALGRVTVQSALGEPLRAEIDIAEISAEESSSLRANVASAEAFKTAGLEYTPSVAGIVVNLQKRGDGRSFLRLSSSRPVTEPFVDLVLEANWSSGRVVRDYTMLFDPPNLRQGAAGVAPTAPQLSRPPAPLQTAPAARPASPPAAVGSAAPTPRAARPVPVPRPVAVSPKSESASPATKGDGQKVTVKAGDTAGRIAGQNKPVTVSLDQMLVALLKNNPDAFIGGNVNRLRSGAVLDIPNADSAAAMPPQEASRTISAQSKDFNDFRRNLAGNAPQAQSASSGQQASGKVQAQVDDRKPAAPTPDKLTLSKGAVQGKAAADEKIAKDLQAKDASTRVAELSKNIGDLNKLSSPPAAGAAASSAAKAPGVPVPAALPQSSITPPAVKASAAPLPASAPSTPASASASAVKATPTTVVAPAPVAAASAAAVAASGTLPATVSPTVAAVTGTASVTPTVSSSVTSTVVATATAAVASAAAAPVVKRPVVVVPPPPEPSLIDELTENAPVLAAFGALLALLAGLGIYKYKKRKSAAQVDSSFLESRLQPDSFFGASGGQRIDTAESTASGSSLVYSPSQLDAAGDVDPVAEADVYLAYGRDLQAEEILKEALRSNPSRVAIHSKLMEIYAKRRDAKAFEVVAVEAFNVTRGEGPEWSYIAEMGRELDSANALYQPGGRPAASSKNEVSKAAASAAAFGTSTLPQSVDPVLDGASDAVDFDIDLDFSINDDSAPAPLAASAASYSAAPAPSRAAPAAVVIKAKSASDSVFDGLDMDFGDSGLGTLNSTVPAPVTVALPATGSVAYQAPVTASKPITMAVAAKTVDSGMMEFDLSSLSLDLPGSVTESPALNSANSPLEGPLETKFALAEEFKMLGDMDGARSLAEEVLTQATGSLKNKAQAFLGSLA